MLTNPVFTFFLGTFVGVTFMCLMNIAKESDEKIYKMIKEKEEKARQNRKNKE